MKLKPDLSRGVEELPDIDEDVGVKNSEKIKKMERDIRSLKTELREVSNQLGQIMSYLRHSQAMAPAPKPSTLPRLQPSRPKITRVTSPDVRKIKPDTILEMIYNLIRSGIYDPEELTNYIADKLEKDYEEAAIILRKNLYHLEKRKLVKRIVVPADLPIEEIARRVSGRVGGEIPVEGEESGGGEGGEEEKAEEVEEDIEYDELSPNVAEDEPLIDDKDLGGGENGL